MKLNRLFWFGFLLSAVVVLLLVTTIAPLATAVAAPAANANFPITTIYTNIPGEPTAGVPGFPGVSFDPGTGTNHFDRVFGSPNGNWILTALTDLPTSSDEVIIANNEVKIFEGDPAPWTAGENVGLIDTRVNINDSGTAIFATNTDGATTSDEYLVMISAAGVFTAVAQEGTSVPGLPPATWGSSIDSGVIAADDTVGFSSDNLTGPPTTENDVLVLGTTILGQKGVTIPSGQLGTEAWENFDVNDYWISADGSHWLAQGDLTGDSATDDIVVVNGTVVVQEGVVLSGTAFTNPVDGSGIVGAHMTANGDWYVRGNNGTSEIDWVYSNNGLVTAVGQPIFVGATEVFSDTDFSDCFFMHVGDGNGNFVIGGVSDGPTLSNGVLVANNQEVIAREGDQLDLDNNGTPDDAYFDTFGNDDAFLTDDGTFYLVATIKDGTDTRIGQGFFSIDISSITNPNTPPTLASVSVTSPANENETVTLSASIVDPDPNDSFILTLDWGDGSVMSTTYPTGTMAVTATHVYLDDAPTGTPSDVYTVSLTLEDSSGGMATDSTPVTVNNLAPTVDAGPDQAVDFGQPVAFSGTFTDTGTLDTHTISWELGGSTTITGTLTPTHTFAASGIYTVTLAVTDDDTGVGQDTMQVTVLPEPDNLIFLPLVVTEP